MQLVELDPKQHGDLKVDRQVALEVAKQQHLVGLKVTEVSQAITCFPVFFTRVSEANDISISAITGIELNRNVFVVDGQWDAIYQPRGMQSYPFYLMNSQRDDKSYTIGIDQDSAAFKTEGEALFDENGKASPYLSAVTAQLDDDMKSEVISYKFCQQIEKLDLLKAIDVLVHHVDGKVTTLTGLLTIDEEKLQALPKEQFETLRANGYLAPIYAMLMSLFQLNNVIRKHNLFDGVKLVKQVTMQETTVKT